MCITRTTKTLIRHTCYTCFYDDLINADRFMITAVQKELIVGLAEKLHGMSELNYEKDCSKRHYEKENLKGYIYKRAAEPDYPVRNSHL